MSPLSVRGRTQLKQPPHPALHRLLLLSIQHPSSFSQNFLQAQIMFFNWFSHSQRMLSLLNLVPIVDPGNLNPCMFWYNSCVLKLTQVQLEEILSQEVLHVSRAVGQDHGNHQLAECLKLQGPSLAGFQLKQPWCLLLPLFCHPSIFSRRSAGFSYLGKSEHIFKVCLCAVEWSATGYSQPGFSCRQAFLFPSICILCSRIAVSHISFFLWRIAGFIFLRCDLTSCCLD